METGRKQGATEGPEEKCAGFLVQGYDNRDEEKRRKGFKINLGDRHNRCWDVFYWEEG